MRLNMTPAVLNDSGKDNQGSVIPKKLNAMQRTMVMYRKLYP
jgi:hypothetical protein